MSWRSLLSLALILNIHSVGCIGGLLSISAAAASSIAPGNTTEALMSLAEPEDYLCSNQSSQNDKDHALKNTQTDSGCSSSECLERTQQDRKQQNALSVSTVLIEFTSFPDQRILLGSRESLTSYSPSPEPLFALAKELSASLIKRE